MTTFTTPPGSSPGTRTAREEARSPSAMSSIWLIAQREINTRVRAKSFVITTAILMAIIVIGLIVWKLVGGGGTSAEHLGIVGSDAALTSTVEQVGQRAGTPIHIDQVPTEQDARDRVNSGDLEAVIVVGENNTYSLISKNGMSEAVAGVLHSSIQQATLAQNLSAQGVDPSALTQATVTDVQTDPTDSDAGQRIIIALVGSMLLIMAIMLGGNMIAVGVVEEKTSRIVELLLATVKPLHLMWGKIIGIGIVSLGQVVLLGATALIAGAATGMLTIASTALWMFAAVLVWFLLGFLFFATLYAAAGALVSRQEELGSTITPLTILSMAVMYAGIFGIQALDSTLIQTLTWIPPFSAVLMPIRIATGDTDALQIVGSLALMVVACLAATWVASRIYERSVLRTGAKVKWSEAVRLVRS